LEKNSECIWRFEPEEDLFQTFYISETRLQPNILLLLGQISETATLAWAVKWEIW
jgi:hypothetical protein